MKDKAYRVAGFLLLSSVLLFVGACASEKPCTIQGTVTVPDPDQTYYAVLVCGDSNVDTCQVVDGAYTLRTRRDPRVQQRIRFIDATGADVGDGGLFDMMEIVADTRKMTVDFDNHTASGSPLTSAMNNLIKETYQIMEGPGPEMDEMIAASEAGDAQKMEELSNRSRQRLDSVLRVYYLAHPDDAVGVQTMILWAFSAPYEELKEMIALGGDCIREDPTIATIVAYRDAENQEDGKAEWVTVGPGGSVVSREECQAVARFEEVTGQGQYVMLDFWGSWCAPCREEIPNVIRLNDKYAGKGLKVIGVTVQDQPGSSLAAIAELKIDYDQLFDLEGVLCNRLQIEGVPHFFLLDPQGEIVLQGHHNLDEFDEYLQQHLR